MHRMLIISLCMLLQACTSPAEKINYYLLHSPSNESVKSSNSDAAIIILGKVELADYLRQDALVMRLNQHELFYSRKDIWAENLQTSIAKTLLTDLNQQSDDYQYVKRSPGYPISPSYELRLEVEHFLATEKSQVVASGKYWLIDKKNGEQIVYQTFNLQQDLNEDGYLHAVEQLRTLVYALSRQINRDIIAL